MTKTKIILKGLLGATALTALSTGTAFAAGTTAGTTVANTFTLDYNVGTTPQTQIVPAAPTTFLVDRVIDVQVTPNTSTTVVADAVDQPLAFTVLNEGNDTQSYVLTPANVTGTDDFDASNLTIEYVIDANNNGINDDAVVVYDGTSTLDVAPDQLVFVTVEGDIPGGVVQDDTGQITLLAETAENSITGTLGTLVTADTDGNDNAVVENVFADAEGDVDGAVDGAHSATNFYVVDAADISAVKLVDVFNEAPASTAACGTFPGTAGTQSTGLDDQYAIPGACVEYTITATNNGAAAATAIDIADTLPVNLTFAGATFSGFEDATGTPVGSLTTLPTVGQDCFATPCVVEYTGGELQDGSTTPTTGVVTIRAIIASTAP